MSQSSFAESESNWTNLFNKTLSVPEEAIQLSYNETTNIISVEIRSLDSTKQKEVTNRLKEKGFITEMKKEKDNFANLKDIKVPDQTLKSDVKPIQGKFGQ